MNHYDYNTPMSERDEPEPPVCPECVKLQRRLECMEEDASEIVYENGQTPPLMRCTPDLPAIVAALVSALESVDQQGEALISEEIWYSSSQAPNLMREVRAALELAKQGSASDPLPLMS